MEVLDEERNGVADNPSSIDEIISFSESLLEDDGSSSSSSANQRAYRQHFNATVEMFGDRSTLTQVVILLACLRNFIQEKRPAELHLSIGKHLTSTDEFTFSVNGQEISQLKVDSGSTLEIN